MINFWKIKALVLLFTKYNHYDYNIGAEIYAKSKSKRGIINLPRPKNLIDYLKKMSDLNWFAENLSIRIPGLFLEKKE